mgnify:CR=1 FL=1
MRKTLFTVAAVGMVAFFTASTASAQCSFDSPGKAKGLKSDMVRAYAPCGSGVTFPAPNTSTGVSGTPACTTPTPYSDNLFSDKGKCSVKASAKLEAPCSGGAYPECSNVKIQAKCAGITTNDTVSGIVGPGWKLNTLTRATFDDRTNGDMTVIDFPVQFDFDPADKGKLKLKSDTNTALFLLLGAGNELPGCTQLDLLSMKIVDDDNDIFATMGVSTR